MDHKEPLMIVFTDELGSTQRDLKLLKAFDKHLDSKRYKREVSNSRKKLFEDQIKKLDKSESWKIIKTVGDSLIISLHSPTQKELKNKIEKCLGSLFSIWEKSNNTIRIVCHLTYRNRIITGTDLKEIKKSFIKHNFKHKGDGNRDLSAVIDNITHDIFGHDINKTARLASVPRNSAFIVSNEIMEILKTPEIVKELKNCTDVKLENEGEGINVIAHKIPIVSLKGIQPSIDVKHKKYLKEQYWVNDNGELSELQSYLEPWHVWEFDKKNRKIDIEKDNIPLRVQSKEFQSLKIVICKFMSTEKEGEKEARDNFKNRLEKNPCNLFIDCVFSVENQNKYYNSELFRNFDAQAIEKKAKNKWWDDVSPPNKTFKPLYVMFSSVPDMKTNKILRKYFTPHTEKWNVQHISYDIYDKIVFGDEKIIVSSRSDGNFFLLLFQIKEQYSSSADDLKMFFNGKDGKLLSSYEKYTCSAYGLLRGEFDGFILFYSKQNKNENLGEIIKELHEKHTTFFYKIAPIFLYTLKLEEASIDNIKYLKSIN